MRSSSRNSRKPSRALTLTAAVSLLLGTAAQAADQPGDHNFVLTAYSNGKAGVDLVSGNYEAASKALNNHPTLSALEPSSTSNNRCVALAVTRQWDAAKSACDQAVRDAQLEKMNLPSYQYWARQFQDEYLAVALSNRAVLRWMSSETDGAATDLKRAAELSPKAAFVARNRAALEYSNPALSAQLAVAPSSP